MSEYKIPDWLRVHGPIAPYRPRLKKRRLRPGPRRKPGPKPKPRPLVAKRPVGRPPKYGPIALPPPPLVPPRRGGRLKYPSTVTELRTPLLETPPAVLVRRALLEGKDRYGRFKTPPKVKAKGWYSKSGHFICVGTNRSRQPVGEAGLKALLDYRCYAHPITGEYCEGWFFGDWLFGTTIDDVIPRCLNWESQCLLDTHPISPDTVPPPKSITEMWAVE